MSAAGENVEVVTPDGLRWIVEPSGAVVVHYTVAGWTFSRGVATAATGTPVERVALTRHVLASMVALDVAHVLLHGRLPPPQPGQVQPTVADYQAAATAPRAP